MRTLFVLIGGLSFGAGLAVSGMTQPEVVLGFLKFEDMGLLLVMGMGVAVTLPTYTWVRRPLLTEQTERFQAWLNGRTLLGSVLFGIGWGISGICPGAAIASLGTLNSPVAVGVAAMLLGGYVEGVLRPNPSTKPAETP